MDGLPGFDPATMTYLATQTVQPNLGDGLDPFEDLLLPMEMPNRQSTYGYVGYETAQGS